MPEWGTTLTQTITVHRCAWCGRFMHVERTGRPRRFDSDECRKAYWKRARRVSDERGSDQRR